jgi:hypothetical protein
MRVRIEIACALVIAVLALALAEPTAARVERCFRPDAPLARATRRPVDAAKRCAEAVAEECLKVASGQRS